MKESLFPPQHEGTLYWTQMWQCGWKEKLVRHVRAGVAAEKTPQTNEFLKAVTRRILAPQTQQTDCLRLICGSFPTRKHMEEKVGIRQGTNLPSPLSPHLPQPHPPTPASLWGWSEWVYLKDVGGFITSHRRCDRDKGNALVSHVVRSRPIRSPHRVLRAGDISFLLWFN